MPQLRTFQPEYSWSWTEGDGEPCEVWFESAAQWTRFALWLHAHDYEWGSA